MTEATPLASEQITQDGWTMVPTEPTDAMLHYLSASADPRMTYAALLSASPAPSGQGVSVPEGMKAYGPDHPDYPNEPKDWNDGGVVYCDDGAYYGGPCEWHRVNGGPAIIAYGDEPAPAPSCAPGEVERLKPLAADILKWRATGFLTDGGPLERYAHDHAISVRSAERKVETDALAYIAALSPQGLDAKEGGE